VTPGEEFSCDSDLADRLIEQGRATLVDDQGRTSDGAEIADPPANTQSDTKAKAADIGVTPTKSKATLVAEVAADEAALATAEAEAAAPPPLPENV
jgi:hypothetical protein